MRVAIMPISSWTDYVSVNPVSWSDRQEVSTSMARFVRDASTPLIVQLLVYITHTPSVTEEEPHEKA